MGGGFSHVALAVFTTLAPMGAGAFLALACAVFAGKLDAEGQARLDKLTVIPLGVFLVGMASAFFHLANPLHAFGVFAGLGSSPLSNELAAVSLFAVAAVVYAALAFVGKLSNGARKGLLAVACVLALVMMVFTGLAYMMETIPSWNTPGTVIQMLGYGIMGGAALGALTLGIAKANVQKPASIAIAALAIAGAALGIAGFGMQLAACGSAANIWGVAIDLVPAAWMLFALLAACSVAGACCVIFASKREFAPLLCGIGLAVVAVGVFFARIGFYGLLMSVGV